MKLHIFYTLPPDGPYYLKYGQGEETMASIKKRVSANGTEFWQVQIRKKGYPPVSKSFEKFDKAREWAIFTEASILKNETINPREATKWTIPQVMKWYRENPNPERRFETKKHHQRLDLLEAEFKDFTVHTLTPAMLDKWLQKRHQINAKATVYHYYVALKNVLVYHSVKHSYSQNMFNVVKCLTTSGRRERRFSTEETAALFKSIKEKSRTKQKEMKVSVLFALETSCRIGEMLKLTWDKVNINERYIDFVADNTKTKKFRRVPITSTARNILKWLKKHNDPKKNTENRVFYFWHINEHHLSRQFQISCHRAGIENIRWHDLRHEAISRYFEKTTLTDIEIATISGHKSLNMLNHYTHLRPSSIIGKLW